MPDEKPQEANFGVVPPPQLDAGPQPVSPTTVGRTSVGKKKKASWFVTAGAALLAKIKAIGLFLVSALKAFKIGKVLLTSGTMLISIFLYSVAFGWWFAVGFVLCIFIHEMGHVFVGYKQKLPMSAPIFIPFMGAVIFNKRGSTTAWGQAIMGVGGPVAGTLAGLACWGIYGMTGNLFFLALAYVTFFMNLFNLIPMVPLDGGWITLAVSPYLWLAGLIVLLYMLFTGSLRNPLVVVLVILAIPRLWQGLRSGTGSYGGLTPATPNQRWIMGACYVALGGFLFWCMSATDLESIIRRQNATHQVAFEAPRTLPRHAFPKKLAI